MWIHRLATGILLDPGSPWQNPFVESLHSQVRDELLDVEEFSCLAEAKVVIADWRGLQPEAAALRAGDAHPGRDDS